MMREKALFTVVLLASFVFGVAPGWAQTVAITPIGSHTGEFCRNDRALLFEDPTGVRILYDPGRSVAGSADPRLGAVHVVLLSSVHSDHIGDVKAAAVNAGTCGSPTTVSAEPNSNTAEIAAFKNAAVIVGGEMQDFLNKKISNVLGAAVASCPAAGLTNEFIVPRVSPCTGILRHGGKRTAKFSGATEGVQIAIVRADHSNGVPRGLLTDPEKSELAADNLSAYVGPENGYVITFTNGLAVYLSGDTGQTSDMATIVNDYYEARLAVVNMGDIFSMGPEEAAFAVKKLIKPKSVIPSHANEAATTGGIVNAGTRTDRFIDLVDGVPVHVPRSGVTMLFDRHGRCVANC
jgi:L-ascorbate metabolism protein UlaG (beta-lactamase superfamily)